MNSLGTYKRLSPEQKHTIIERAFHGEKVSDICRESGISRTIFYKWLKEYSSTSPAAKSEPLITRNPRGRKHWRRLKATKEREVVRLWKENPEYPMRKIASLAQVSLGAAWNVLRSYKEEAEKRGRTVKRYVRKSYKTYTPQAKIQLIKRYQTGEPIAKIAREAGISRTIFYKWLRAYESSKNAPNIFQRHHPKGEQHWRFMQGVRDTVLDVVSQDPKLSLSALASKIKEEGKSISKSGLYYMLKSMGLDTYPARLAYATTRNTIILQPQPEPRFIQRFALASVLSFIAAFSLLYMLNFPFRIGNPITTITPTPTTTEPREDKGRQAGDYQPTAPERTEQDFTWGGLAFDTRSDTYATGEEIEMGFGIVDHAGNTVCNAEISLEITDPQGKKVHGGMLSDPQVRQSGECSLQSTATTPDYLVTIPPLGEEGEYAVTIKATTYEGEREFRQKLLVRNSQPIDVKRSSYPTRIFPRANYPVEIHITPQRDFRGTISENIPGGITATEISGAGRITVENGTDRSITWDVDLRKGQTYSITYTLHFPMKWPEFYEIGPMKFVNEAGKLVYQEARFWQVVADAL